MNASAENTVCYPAAEHNFKCPITYINIVGESEAKAAEKRGEVTMLKLTNDMAIVYSKKTDALPVTTIKVENRPCVSPQIISNARGTIILPNEVSSEVT